MGKQILNKNVLVLNRSFYPINVTIVRDAIGLIYKESASYVIHKDMKSKFNGGEIVLYKYGMLDYREWVKQSEIIVDDIPKIHSAKYEHIVPVVISVKHDKVPSYYIKLSRNGIYNRDSGKCQYCGIHVDKKHFTVDHIVPKSKGGKSTWNNMVTCCKACNAKKDDKSLGSSGMKLLSKPVKPGVSNFSAIYVEEHKYWKDFIGGMK